MTKLLYLSVAFLLINIAEANPLEETRYCTVQPERNSDGKIARRFDVLYAFRSIHPCPVTGKIYGACPGWNIDHIIPLAVGGCDSVSNLQWLPVEIKRCGEDVCKDRWERKVYLRKTM